MIKNILILLITIATSLAFCAQDTIKHAITNQDIHAIKKIIATQQFTIAEKRQIVQFAADTAAAQEKQSFLSNDSKKTLLAVACVSFLAISGSFLQTPILYLGMSHDLSHDFQYYAPHLFASALCAGAGVLAGYESMEGYYTNRSSNIRDILSNALKSGYYQDGVYYSKHN